MLFFNLDPASDESYFLGDYVSDTDYGSSSLFKNNNFPRAAHSNKSKEPESIFIIIIIILIATSFVEIYLIIACIIYSSDGCKRLTVVNSGTTNDDTCSNCGEC